jgi:hypothetical protein
MESIANTINDEKLVEDAYERVKAELAALDPKDLIQVNLEVTAAIVTTLGVIPEVKALREQIAKDLPNFDLASFDKLEDYTLALHYAQTAYLTATQPPDDLVELTEESKKVRDQLEKDATALAGRGLVDANAIAQLKGGVSYKNMAQDLQILSGILKASWSSIQSKTAITMDDLNTASKLSLRLMRVVGLREQGPATLQTAVDTRLRAFTRFLSVYEDVRRAVGYLRGPHGDADTVAPSLYPGRPRRRNTDEPSTDPIAPVGTAPGASVPAAPGTAAVPGTSAPGATTTPGTNAALINQVGPFAS